MKTSMPGSFGLCNVVQSPLTEAYCRIVAKLKEGNVTQVRPNSEALLTPDERRALCESHLLFCLSSFG